MQLGPEPKQPPSAYLIFNMSFVAEYKLNHTDAKVTEAFKAAGEAWKTADKSKYEKQAMEARKLFEKQMQ